MKVKNILKISAIIIGALMCFGFNKVQATDSIFDEIKLTRENLKFVAKSNILTATNDSTILGISETRQTGNKYNWSINTTQDSKKVWKIAKYSSITSNDADYNNLYYCLNAERGFGLTEDGMAEGAKDTYNIEYEINDTNQTSIINAAGGSLETNYNKILWILDNSYIPTGSDSYRTSAEYINFKNKTRLEYDLTEEQIEVVQQMAIWYFTNNSYEDPIYNRGELPNLYKNGEQMTQVVYIDEDGPITTYDIMNKLYKYLINNASSTYLHRIPTLSLSNSNVTVEENNNYFIIGPFNLSGTNTELINEITATVIPIKSYDLLKSNKTIVNDNNFTEVIGNSFYLRFLKSDITESTQVNLNLNYKYNIRDLTFMTSERPNSTQPVVLLKQENTEKSISTDTNILLTQISVEKVWEDNNNQDGKRPSSIKVSLYEGENKIEEQTLSKNNSWKYTWNSLIPGKNYSVKEEDTPTGYTVEYTTVNNKTTITNIYKPLEIDLSLRKYITSINEKEIKTTESYYRVPNINTSNLDNKTGTTSKYVHKKNPISVKTGDIIVYNITIYNEGETDARASKIKDQLPTGIEFERVLTNGYTSTYDADTNIIEIIKTGNNNLAAYTKNGNLSSETIQIECKVIEEAGENQKILTNIAWISEMISDERIVTDDIDSDTNDLNYNKDNMSDYERPNENGYYPGNQDDDDFDRLILEPEIIPETVNKTVTKEWLDSNNEDNLRPEKIEVQLYKTVNEIKTAVGERKELNTSNRWTYTWENLLKKENENDIVYSVEEVNVPTGYVVNYSANDYSVVDTITITNTHNVTPPSGKYNIVLKKVDGQGNLLSNAEIKVNGRTYAVGTQNLDSNVSISSTNDIVLNYTLEETKPPEGYIGLSTIKNIRIHLTVVQSGKTYTVTRASLINEDGEIITDSDIKLNLDTATSTITINVINNEIEPEFDVALRKFITKINDNEINREPIVDTSTIATTGTATYKHTKEPVSVQVGDIITYKIRVYNEGEKDGYVAKITDHLPEWLDFIADDETNIKYLWNIDDNRKISTEVTKKDSATGENLYSARNNKQLLKAYDGGTTLDYIDVEIRCRVNNNAEVGKLLTNIAEISKMQDLQGTEIITDRDSTKANINLPTDTNLPVYIGNYDNKADLTDSSYYYAGQEDDDDFEKVIVENFDLALRKFITKINNEEYDREPIVDASNLDGNYITTATYTHNKNTLNVKKGDIITYTLRIFNEGTLSGYATEVIDYIPEGLEFVEESSINMQYEWVQQDGKFLTTYLADQLINGVTELNGNKNLDYKDVQIQLKVTADPLEYMGKTITNWAEIGDDSNNDIDSTPGNIQSDEDDIDFEPVKVVYLDLSLRKFITNVNGTEYNNRIPEVDTSKYGTLDENDKLITSFTYTHTKDPVVVETESTVIYTIRVYNEGTLSGYALELIDNIPEGLEFLPQNETNIEYKWKMLDEEGNITEDSSKAKKITTTYLADEILNAYQKESGSEVISYEDVEVAFKVIESNISDRVVINTAEISKASDEDIDSIPENNDLTEDDIDREYLKVKYFDLALKKWVTEARVTYNGKTKITKTGFDENSIEMAKVDLVSSKLKKTTVKFVYNIKVINEGEVAGYATEIEDYIPKGLKFVESDNPKWKLIKDGVAVTDQLKDTLIEPGQSAIVEIVLTWKNSSSNMGVKTNWAEIKEDSGDDVDSIPDNNDTLEDDIDNAQVILSIKTGTIRTYIFLGLISVIILAGGTFAIKKYVIDR